MLATVSICLLLTSLWFGSCPEALLPFCDLTEVKISFLVGLHGGVTERLFLLLLISVFSLYDFLSFSILSRIRSSGCEHKFKVLFIFGAISQLVSLGNSGFL